jgi:CTP:molybdopterin cytidylyltransferase MocA
VDAIVVGLADQPLVTPESWKAVAHSDAAIAVATYDGQRRNPVKLSSTVWDLLPASGDQGARVVMRTRPDLVREVPCRGDPMDIDTREDLEIWS